MKYFYWFQRFLIMLCQATEGLHGKAHKNINLIINLLSKPHFFRHKKVQLAQVIFNNKVFITSNLAWKKLTAFLSKTIMYMKNNVWPWNKWECFFWKWIISQMNNVNSIVLALFLFCFFLTFTSFKCTGLAFFSFFKKLFGYHFGKQGNFPLYFLRNRIWVLLWLWLASLRISSMGRLELSNLYCKCP